MKTDLFIELNGRKTDCGSFVDTVKEIWKSEGNLVKDIETVQLYYKPEEQTCYYVINNNISGSFHA